MRQVWIPLLNGLVVVSGCAHSKPAATAASPSSAKSSVPSVAITQSSPKKPGLIQVALHARVGAMKIERQPLDEVIQAIREDTGQNITVDWQALQAAGVTHDRVVTADLSRLTLDEALDKLLASVGVGDRLGYTVGDGTVTIGTAKPPEVQVALDVSVGPMNVEGRSLSDVIGAVREQSGQSIFVNWRALDAIRVTRDLPVTADLSHLTLAKALDKLLTEVGGSQERLGYTIDDGVITISTQKDLGKNTLTRVYDVRDLLKNRATRDADLTALTKRFKGIDPLSWRDAGGTIGSIRELQGQLIITQTPEVHKRIAGEIEALLPDQPEKQQFPILNSRAEPAKK